MIIYWGRSPSTGIIDANAAQYIFRDWLTGEIDSIKSDIDRINTPYILNVEVTKDGMRYVFSDGRVAEVSAANKIYKP